MNKITEIKDNFLIGIGDNYIIITLGQDPDNLLKENQIKEKPKGNNNDDKTINLKIYSGNIKQRNVSFDKNKSKILIGRCSECDIIIEDYMLSRFHCTFFFQNGKWFICDGLMENENHIKNSTNGTWIYAFEDTIIYDNMKFKSNNNLFVCTFEK